jgi:hypothetical protein
LGSAGGTINQLVATCAGGATPFTFAWARTGNCGGTSAMSSSATQGDSVPANTGAGSLSCTYTATVSNPSGSATPSATVTVAGKTSGIDCKSSAQGLPLGSGISGNTSTIQIPWVIDSANTLLTGNGTIAPQHSGMAVVGVIQVPPGAATSSNIGRIDIHEYGSTPIYRLATLSQTPCSWGNPLDPATFTSFQLDPNFYFTVGPNSSGYAQMQPGSTWYINVVMQNPTKVPPKGDTCGSADPCNFVIEFWKPNGT